MNVLLSWRPNERQARALRDMLRRGTRVSHHMFSVVGCLAIAVSLALWLMPNVRGALAARLMPLLSAAVQAGPERLLSGNPLPSMGSVVSQDKDGEGDSLEPTAYDPAATAAPSQAETASRAASPLSLAQQIPTRQVAVDARDNRSPADDHAQALVADYLSRRYHVAAQPVRVLVKAAFQTGQAVNLDPLLLLAVMAIESGFNPYAESGVGAQGLMQVMSKVHSDKFEYFGGPQAALSPLANIQVGALVLKDCVARGGSVAGGLRLYVGSTSQDDGGYGARVMAERDRLRRVVRGIKVPIITQDNIVKVSTSATAAPAKRVHATLEVSPASGTDPKAVQSDADAGGKTELGT